MTPAHAAWDELAAGYAVNALEPEDEQAFAAHLRGCDRCRETLASLQAVTGNLAYAVEPAEPPADLKASILAAAGAERPAVFSSAPPALARAPRQRRNAGGRVWQPTFRLATLASAAAVLAVLSLGVWNLTLRGDGNAKELALQRRTEALRCLAAPEAQKFQLSSAGGQRAATCLAGGNAYVVVDRLDRNDAATSVYVLWWMDKSEGLHPVAGFDVDSPDTAVFRLPLNAAPADVRAMAISLEPGRGLPAAPTRRIAYGEATSA